MYRHLSHSAGRRIGNFRVVTEADKRRFITVFRDCDEGSKGYICREDLKVAVVMLCGYKPSKYEVDQMMKMGTGSGGMSQEHFVAMMSSKMATQDRDEEIRQSFMTFDTHCHGFITKDDLYRAFGEVAPHTPRHRIDTVFREIDRDSDGRVSYRDFEFMMNYCLEEGF